MQIRPFAIERFYERWEFRAELMLSSSDCESRTVEDLLELEPEVRERLLGMRLGYTEVPGSEELRAAVAGGYERAAAEDVLTLAAAEEGIFLVYHALVEPGDHVVVEAPCYGSAIEVARSTGARVSLWQRRHEDGWAHDLDELERLLEADTRAIYINSPHNPTGTQMTGETFERVVELAGERSAVLFGDEVYRGLEHDPADAATGGVRRLRAGDLAGDGVQGARAAGAAHRLARVPPAGAAGPRQGAEAVHHDLLERSERTAGGARAPPRRRPDRAQPGTGPAQPAPARRVPRPPWGDVRVGPAHRRADRVRADAQRARRGGLVRADGRALRRAGAARLVYEQPHHVRFGFGRANLPLALERLDGYLG